MCTRQESTALHWRQVRLSRGDLRMSLLMWCMLVLFLCSNCEEMAVAKSRPERWHLYQMKKGQNFKRHSDGTFTSDFTHYLDKIKAKDFVEWLASTKREGCHEDLLRVAADM